MMERLGEVIVGAQLCRPNCRPDVLRGCQHQDGKVRRATFEPLEHCQTIDVREPQIQQNNIWPIGRGRSQS
jgi:hypothetical protein